MIDIVYIYAFLGCFKTTTVFPVYFSVSLYCVFIALSILLLKVLHLKADARRQKFILAAMTETDLGLQSAAVQIIQSGCVACVSIIMPSMFFYHFFKRDGFWNNGLLP